MIVFIVLFQPVQMSCKCDCLLECLVCSQVLYTGKNFVACAPTGSGKTVLFELAIIRLLMETSEPWRDVKAVYSEHNIVKTLLICQ